MSLISPKLSRAITGLPGLSDAQRQGLRIQATTATTPEAAASLYQVVKEYAPANDGRVAVTRMASFARVCAAIAEEAGLQRKMPAQSEEQTAPPTAEDVEVLEDQLTDSRKRYLASIALAEQ